MKQKIVVISIVGPGAKVEVTVLFTPGPVVIGYTLTQNLRGIGEQNRRPISVEFILGNPDDHTSFLFPSQTKYSQTLRTKHLKTIV
jgi:hypothetical protein